MKRGVFLYFLTVFMRPGLVEVSVCALGGPLAARSLLSGLLLLAVDSPEKEEAIRVVVALPPAEQAQLAQVIQELTATEREERATRRRVSTQRRFSDVGIAGNDPLVIEPLQAEAGRSAPAC